MERDKNNFSTFSVPATMSDITLISTPLPQAASTATKRRSMGANDDLSQRDFVQTSGNVQEIALPSNKTSPLSQKYNKREMKKLSVLEDSCKSMSDMQEEVVKVLEAQKQSNPQKHGDYETVHLYQLQKLLELQKLRSDLKYNSDLDIMMEKTKAFKKTSDDFEFRVPSVPSGSMNTKKFGTDIEKCKLPRSSKIDTSVRIPSSSRFSYDLPTTDNLVGAPEKLNSSASSNFGSARDPVQLKDSRISIASSANSSFGIISPDVLEDAQRQPLIDVNQDLSLRLAQQLNLDSSLLKDGLEVSTLAMNRYKEKVSAKLEENKENQRNSGRSSSSDYWTLHGYSSDNSDSRNNTAKRLSSLSTGSGGEGESCNKLNSSPKRASRPLSEMNFSSCHRTSSSMSGRSSVSSKPFDGYSIVSISSNADFQSGEDVKQTLDRDESQFSLSSTRSLSGIYGDDEAFFSVNGEKLSMSSFLRSGSDPLGNMETGGNESQRPQFGMPANSPEKKGKPRAILPPPQDKSTFLVDELPEKDTPWAPHSLIEQFSNIHTTNITDSDTSVPSLSCISQMLEHMHEGANPRDVLGQLMELKTKNKPDKSMKPNRISSIVEGENSFCQGIDAERSLFASNRSNVQQLSLCSPPDESATSSICNVTDFEGDEEACVCVMTPESMDFDIFNELSQPVEYSFSKACYVDGQRKDQAAYINLPFSKLILFPGQKRTLTITIAALIGGVIKIKIEVVRKNPVTQARECSNVYGKVVAELPKVSLVTHHGEMTPNPDCEFDGKYQHTIVMKNNGRCVVPLKLTLAKVTHDDVMFNFGEREKKTVTVMIEPGQTISQLVQCETPPVFAELKSPETIIPVEARVDFLLATTDLHKITPVNPVTVVAPLKPYFFGAQSRLTVPSSLTLYNSCDYPVIFKTVVELGYIVQPSAFSVPPHQKLLLSVRTAEIKNPLRRGELVLHSLNPRGMYTVKLREERRSSASSNNSLATPQSSRATSPSSNLGASVEELKVACSHKQLVWGGCPLHQVVVKPFCLKNMGRQREKLRLTISDRTRCFKILNEMDTLQSELKLSLQPMENREIKVAVLATVPGPQWGHLTISRICSPADKNVLPLYAFGGRSKVNLAEGVLEVAQHTYLLLDVKTLQSSLILSNTGDHSAFFRITANTRSSSGLSISPQEKVLPAGSFMTIHIGLSVTADRIEYLLRQSTQSVCVAQLTICYGDESTRQRLMRIMEIKSLDKPLAHTVAELSTIHASAIPNLDKLDGSLNDAEKLWQEDTDECTIGVFIKRSALEARRLDTSVNFVDLSKTTSEH